MADQEDGLDLTQVRLPIAIKIDAAKLAKVVTPLDVLGLIQDLDDEVGLWAMTILLGRYFEEQLKIASEVVPELFAASEDELMDELHSAPDSDYKEPEPVPTEEVAA